MSFRSFGFAQDVRRMIRTKTAAGWALLGIVILAAGLRFWNLGAESLWLDEALSFTTALKTPAQIVVTVAEDIHPPVYYWLLHLWLMVGHSEAAIRSLSAVIGVGSVVALYALGRALEGRGTGLLASLLLAVSPLHIGYSQETRMYALVTLWAILSSWLLVCAWNEHENEREGTRRRRLAWVGYVLVVTLGFYTHYFMGFVVLAQNLYIGFLLLRRRLPRPALGRWIVAQLAWVVLFAPWVPTVVHQIRAGGGAWVADAVGRPSWGMLLDTILGFTVGPARDWLSPWFRRAAYAIGALLIIAPAWTLVRPQEREGERNGAWTQVERMVFCFLLFAVPIVLAWLVSQIKPIYKVRYLLPALPSLCLWLALGAGAWRQTRLRAAGAALAVLLLLVNLGGSWTQAVNLEKPDWRGVTAYIVNHQQVGDVVLPQPAWNADLLRYYAGGQLRIYDQLPAPATVENIPPAVAEVAAGGGRLWFIEDVAHYENRERLLAGYLNDHFRRLSTLDYPRFGPVVLYQLGQEER
jgi:mannosyltransferase